MQPIQFVSYTFGNVSLEQMFQEEQHNESIWKRKIFFQNIKAHLNV